MLKLKSNIFFFQLQYLRKVRAKHEAEFARVPQNGIMHRASAQSNSTLKNSSSQILGPLGKYLEVMHSHSS